MRDSIVTLNIRLEAVTRQDGDQWLAWCPPIDVMTQASTERQALTDLREAVELWFESCLERGVLDEALKEAGFRSNSQEPADAQSGVIVSERPEWRQRSRRDSHPEYIEVKIPAYVAAAQTRAPRATC